MKNIIRWAVLPFALCYMGNIWAQSDVYLCVDEKGNREYKNNGATKGCKKVELPGITSIPAPKTSARPTAPPADFPRVNEDTQKNRDNERHRVLQDELNTEEQKLTALKKSFNNGEPERQGDEKNYAKYQERIDAMKEDIARSEKNIEALKREINN